MLKIKETIQKIKETRDDILEYKDTIVLAGSIVCLITYPIPTIVTHTILELTKEKIARKKQQQNKSQQKGHSN
jgi:hypothetical protein